MDAIDIVTENMEQARREYEQIQLDDLIENPRYERWNKKLINDLYKISKDVSNNESKRLADILILGYIDWCKLNDKDIFNPVPSNVENNIIVPLDRNREIRELIQLHINGNTVEINRQCYVGWIILGIIFVVSTLTFGLLH